MAKRQEQYRPSFTLAELLELLEYIPAKSALKTKLTIYVAKVSVGLNAAAYISEPKQSLEDKLGFSPVSPVSGGVAKNAEAYMQKLQIKQQIAPESLTPEDRFNILAQKAISGEITAEERIEGSQLEQELYGMDMGTFAST